MFDSGLCDCVGKTVFGAGAQHGLRVVGDFGFFAVKYLQFTIYIYINVQVCTFESRIWMYPVSHGPFMVCSAYNLTIQNLSLIFTHSGHLGEEGML